MLTHDIKKFKLGVIAPREIETGKISLLLDEKKAHIGHLITNDVQQGGLQVINYAQYEKIPYTVYPVAHIAGGILASNMRVVHDSDFIYIIDNGDSGNAVLAERECQKQSKKYRVVKL